MLREIIKSSLKNLAIIFMLSYFSLAHSMLATNSHNFPLYPKPYKKHTINQCTGNYTFYDSNNNVLARLPKSTIYKLSEVIAKSAHFGDHDHFVIDITDRLTDKISELLPESWDLFLQYLQAHQQEAESDKNTGAVCQVLNKIKHAPPIVLLDLLCFSLRYQFKDITESLMPYIGYIWQHYQAEINPQDEPSSITNLERLIERIFYSKNVFIKSILSSNRYYYPAFYAASVENVITHDSDVKSLAISSDSSFIVSGSDDGRVKLYDKETEQVKTIITHDGGVCSVAISNDSSFIVSGSDDKMVKLYDIKTKLVDDIITHNGWVNCLAISNDSSFIVSGSWDGAVKLYDIKTKLVDDIITHNSSVNCVAISSDGRFIVSGYCDGVVKLYDIKTKLVDDIITHDDWVKSIAISSDCRLIVSGSRDGTVKLYDIEIEQVETIITHNNAVFSIVISSDGRFIVSGSIDGVVKLYDIKTKLVNDIITHDGSVKSIAISSDGRFIVSGSWDGVVKLYDRETGQVKTIITNDGGVLSVAISSDGRFIVSQSTDGIVKLAGNIDKLNYKEFFELIQSIQ